jgi:hypothetical protein
VREFDTESHGDIGFVLSRDRELHDIDAISLEYDFTKSPCFVTESGTLMQVYEEKDEGGTYQEFLFIYSQNLAYDQVNLYRQLVCVYELLQSR